MKRLFYSLLFIGIISLFLDSCSGSGKGSETKKQDSVIVEKPKNLDVLVLEFQSFVPDDQMQELCQMCGMNTVWKEFRTDSLEKIKKYRHHLYLLDLVDTMKDTLKRNCFGRTSELDWGEALSTNYDSSKVAMLMIEVVEGVDENLMKSGWKDKKPALISQLKRIENGYGEMLRKRQEKWEKKEKTK